MRAAARAAVATLALAAAPVLTAAGPAPDAFTGEMTVILWKGLFRGADPGSQAVHLILHLACEGGRWAPVQGMAPGYNNGFHDGCVQEGAVGGGGIRLELTVLTGSDLWVRGGQSGLYTVALKRAAGRRRRSC